MTVKNHGYRKYSIPGMVHLFRVEIAAILGLATLTGIIEQKLQTGDCLIVIGKADVVRKLADKALL